MIVVSSIAELPRHGLSRVAVACGVFDGVHRGHQKILAALGDAAAPAGLARVVLTFEPHPRSVLQSAGPPPRRLTTPERKLQLLERFGADAVVVQPFTPVLAAMPAEEFLRSCMMAPGLQLAAVCVGRDWRFGRGGSGTTEFLRAAGRERGFRTLSVSEFTLYGKPVSSTRIRTALAAGRLGMADRCLGRPYSVTGEVVRGRGMGRKVLDCPTANLVPVELLPRSGVYAARGRLLDDAGRPAGAWRDGIAYVGSAPTFLDDASAPVILEFHVFDQRRKLYGRRLEVAFLRLLRPDRRFPAVAALLRQMAEDIRHARTFLAAHPAAAD